MASIGLGNLRKPAARRRGLVFHGAIGLAAALALGLTSGSALAQGSKRIAGLASYYSKNYHGRVASGGHYDPHKFTAAHRTLPFGTRLRVTDPQDPAQRDRGGQRPRAVQSSGRVLDLSLAAAKALHMTGRGVIRDCRGGAVAVRPAAAAASELVVGEQRIQVSGSPASASPSRRCTVFSSSSVMKTVLPAARLRRRHDIGESVPAVIAFHVLAAGRDDIRPADGEVAAVMRGTSRRRWRRRRRARRAVRQRALRGNVLQ